VRCPCVHVSKCLIAYLFYYRVTYEDGSETVQSSGEGIEREVIHTILEEFRSSGTEWYVPRADGHSTLATTHTLSTARHIPRSRLRNLSILGAVTALSLIHGISAAPLDPVLLHFFIHDFDVASLHPALIGEWHPELKQTIADWHEMGPRGDITQFQQHFAVYHDIQVRQISAFKLHADCIFR
jgi:hypothetical protein